MPLASLLNRYRLLAIVLAVTVACLLLWFYRTPIWTGLSLGYQILIDREKTLEIITAAGGWAPLAFMGIQILQVLLAPIPGEATGFIGGYLFGAGYGFVYSSISLALGSWLNFFIGRILGRRYVRRLIPKHRRDKIDRAVTHQGLLILFSLFIFPGFPKDYLCLFLGVTRLPLKVFLPMAAIGRMPGTLMLSLQGALLFERMYGIFAAILAVCALVLLVGYRHRAALYRWIDRLQNSGKNFH